MLTAADMALLIALVGETPDGRLTQVAPALAGRYTWDTQYPGFGLEALHVERDLTKVAHGYAWQQIQTGSADVTLHFEQRAKALQGRLAQLETEIALRLEQARASTSVISVGQMTTTAPTAPPYPPPYPDANDPLYRGTTYSRPLNPQRMGW